jgi:hypothetical protein
VLKAQLVSKVLTAFKVFKELQVLRELAAAKAPRAFRE